MQIRSLVTILLGASLAAGASFAAMNMMNNRGPGDAVPAVEMVTVVVAGQEIAFGQLIERQMLTIQSWPRSAVMPGTYGEIGTLFQGEPRRALTRIFPGEVLLSAKLSAPGEKVTLVQKLTPGHRAMAISVDAATAVGGFVSPGDRVDIVMTEGNGTDMRAATVLQNIRVVGIDQTSEEQQDAPVVARTITVEVTPDDGQKLALAQRAGRLSLTLREADAAESEPLTQIQLTDLFETRKPEAIAPVVPGVEVEVVAPVRPSVIIRRGTSDKEEVFLR